MFLYEYSSPASLGVGVGLAWRGRLADRIDCMDTKPYNEPQRGARGYAYHKPMQSNSQSMRQLLIYSSMEARDNYNRQEEAE